MLTSSQLASFLVASLVLCVTPGPGVTYIVTRSASQGRRAGLGSVAGVALGNALNAMAAAFGLAAVLAASAFAFHVVKYAGAAYLVYLGAQALRGAGRTAPAAAHDRGAGRNVRDGLAVAALNPKTALFFAAYVPQFVTPGHGATLRALALSLAFVLMALVTDSLYAITAGSIAPKLSQHRSPYWGRFIAGGVYIGLGVLAAVSGRPARS